MEMILKPKVIFPILFGVAVGAVLFAIGSSEDAPGMCLIGLSSAFVMIMLGINNTSVIKKGFLAPIFLFCFGIAAVILSIVLLLNDEFEQYPQLSFIGISCGIIFTVCGTVKLRKRKTGN